MANEVKLVRYSGRAAAPCDTFKHYVVKARGMRGNVGGPLRHFCDASVLAHLSAQSLYRAVDIIAIYTDGRTRLARVVKGAQNR